MKKGTITIIAVAAVVLGCILWFKGAYNSMVTAEEGVSAAWSQVENVYQRRADLIPNLVATVKGYAAHESSTLEGVVEARSKATQVTVSAEDLSPEALAKFNEAQGEYYSHMNEVGGMVSIPTGIVGEDLEKIGAVIETMAAYSVDTLTPAYYDISLISKSTRDEESRPMIELILENRIYDLGYVFDAA